MKSIDTIINGILLNSYDINWIYIYHAMYSNNSYLLDISANAKDLTDFITPLYYNQKFKRENMDILKDMYFVNLFHKVDGLVEVYIKYNDDTQRNIIADICQLKYEITD